MTDLTVLAVAGCRPNFVKLAPLFREMGRHESIRPVLVHTGQHYDQALSGVFFRDLREGGLPRPDVHLEVGSGSHAVQTARVMEAIEETLLERAPDLVLVVGDVNSTIAAAMTAVKLGIPVAHVEAGLRSFDREMPEEVNRVLTDSISDLLFVTERSGMENLRREGVADEKVHHVGNVMVDALMGSLDAIGRTGTAERFDLTRRRYAVATVHRPDNVDDPEHAREIVTALCEVQAQVPLVFPVHPRTRGRFEEMGLWRELEEAGNLTVTGPLGYLEFLDLVRGSALVLTDSGGLQEESTALGVPCLTLRPSTERPATVEEGTNRIVGRDREAIASGVREVLDGEWRTGSRPELWDGHAAERIVRVLLDEAENLRGLYPNLRARTPWKRAKEASAA